MRSGCFKRAVCGLVPSLWTHKWHLTDGQVFTSFHDPPMHSTQNLRIHFGADSADARSPCSSSVEGPLGSPLMLPQSFYPSPLWVTIPPGLETLPGALQGGFCSWSFIFVLLIAFFWLRRMPRWRPEERNLGHPARFGEVS